MAKNNNLTDFLTDVADAIREATGKTGLIDPQDFSSEIASISSGGGEALPLVQGIDLSTLPQAGSMSQPDYKQINDNTYLMIIPTSNGLSSYGTYVCSYNITTHTLTQLFSDEYSEFEFICELTNGDWIISGETATSTYIYHKATDTVSQIGYSGCSFAVQSGNIVLMPSMMGVAKYNISTNYYDDYAWMDDYGYNSGVALGDKIFLSANARGSVDGVLMYDVTNDTFNKIYTTGRWSFDITVNDRALGIGSTNTERGLLICDSTTGVATKIYISQVGTFRYHDASQAFCTDSNGSTVYYYSYSSNTLSKISSGHGSSYYYFYKVSNDEFLLGSVTRNNPLLKFIISTNAVSTLYSKSGNHFYITVSDKILMISASGIDVYNITAGSVTALSTVPHSAGIGQVINNELCLIAPGESDYGLELYDSTTGTLSTIDKYFAPSSHAITFTMSGNDCYIEGLHNNISVGPTSHSSQSTTDKLYIKLKFTYSTRQVSVEKIEYMMLPSKP